FGELAPLQSLGFVIIYKVEFEPVLIAVNHYIRQAVRRAHPYIALVVLLHVDNGIVGQAVLFGQVGKFARFVVKNADAFARAYPNEAFAILHGIVGIITDQAAGIFVVVDIVDKLLRFFH